MNQFMAGLLGLLILLAATPAAAQEDWQEAYAKKEVMIPMRDGVRLYTCIYAPKDTTLAAPVLLSRTPYSLAPYFENPDIRLADRYGLYLRNRYILVFQNVRGTMMSEGDFEQIRPIHIVPDLDQTDEATDTYDSVDWLLAHTSNNGNVGVHGSSYGGFYATSAALSGHPAIKAVSAQAPIADWFMGDDVHINGAFLNSIYTFGARMFRNRPLPVKKSLPAVVQPEGDYYDYFLEKGGLGELFEDFGDSLQFFNDIRQHPHYDSFWKERNPLTRLRAVTPAVMVVGGWFDREDLYGTLATYRAFQEKSPQTPLYLVMGPWKHGSWNNLGFHRLAGAYVGKGSAEYFQSRIQFPFFEKYLNGRLESLPRVQYLPSAETMAEVMENCQTDDFWKTSPVWPPVGAESVRYYLSADKELSTVRPQDKTCSYRYASNPDRPVPCTGKIMKSWASDEAAGDQSYLTWRSDVLSFQTEELTDTLKVVGPVAAHISVSASTTDADLVVKIIDVRPDGYQMLLRWTVLPLRYRNSFEKPEKVIPGKRMEVDLRLDDVAHYFMPGHRLMVQVQSSMFPWVAMNPQTFLENPYAAKRSDYRCSEIHLQCNRNHPSYVTLPVLD